MMTPSALPASIADAAVDTVVRVVRTQRLAALHLVDELPSSPIGKVLKRELRESHAARHNASHPNPRQERP
jgi:acyl-CoA synthetase (AMP-forming)/AMP-acid ligase II